MFDASNSLFNVLKKNQLVIKKEGIEAREEAVKQMMFQLVMAIKELHVNGFYFGALCTKNICLGGPRH